MARQWLIDARRAQGLTQAEAAEKAGISQCYYAALELGKRGHNLPFKTAQRIAKVLKVEWQMFYETQERDALCAYKFPWRILENAKGAVPG